MEMIYFTDDQFCPAHPEQMNKCTQKHGRILGGWAYFIWWNGELWGIASPEGEESEPRFGIAE